MSEKIKVLQRELDALHSQIAALEAVLEDKPDYGLGGGAPSVTRWEMDRTMLERLVERAERLEEALSEMTHGTYGICTRCGQPIHPDRLAVLPDTQICIRCAQADTTKKVSLQSAQAKAAA